MVSVVGCAFVLVGGGAAFVVEVIVAIHFFMIIRTGGKDVLVLACP